MKKSVVDIGMEILRAEGALRVPEPKVESDDVNLGEEEDDDESELKVMQALTNQLQAMTDRLSLAETVKALSEQVTALSGMVQHLCTLVTQPRIKVPVRDEAGRIIEVREVAAPMPEMGEMNDDLDAD
jgi:hypothetical protein